MSAHGAGVALTTPSRARTPVAARPLLAAPVARLIAFSALAAFGALHWAMLVVPRGTGALLGALGAAVLAGTLLAATTAPTRLGRALLVAGAALGVGLAGLLFAGVPARLLWPGGWGELGAGIGQGVQALADVRVPYEGADAWPRIVILAGGALLVGLAGVAYLRARRGAAGRGVALVALGFLYGVPAVEITMSAQFARGAAFAVLLAAFLWLEALPRSGAGAGLAAVAAAVLVGLLAAPALDARRSWVDYEELAQSLAPAAGLTFDFNHRYGPIDWSRDGREVLRVRARSPAYWKAENLDSFDGLRWVTAPEGRFNRAPLSAELPPRPQRRWRQRIQVTVRGLETRSLIGAGTTFDVLEAPSAPVSSGSPGTFALESPLERGDSYLADVYVPKPTAEELARAGTAYPQLSGEYLTLGLLGSVNNDPGAEVILGPFGSGVPGDVAGALESSAYGRTWALAQRLRAGVRTPYEYVRAIQGHLRRGFTYTETPPSSPVPLESFLFADRQGYCQQFSGAMALLLRMGGVPARVAGGFSTGSYSARRGDYVVRDIDAHSWVEVYFPGYGWVAFDPTPPAAPARSQVAFDLPSISAAARALPGLAQPGDRPEPGSRLPGGVPGAQAPGEEGGRGPWPWVALLVAAGAAGAVLHLRRRPRRDRRATSGDPAIAELERALQRIGRPAPAGATIQAIERRFGSEPGAVAYLRCLREARFGWAAAGPGGVERRGLRRALAQEGGPLGALRAWWALPPRRRVRADP